MYKVGIVGVGHVGLALLVEFFEKGVPVVGIDVSESRVQWIRAKIAVDSDFLISTDFSVLEDCNYLIFCVSTPVKDAKPDFVDLECAVRDSSVFLRSGDVVVLESTVYPGYTEGAFSDLIMRLRPDVFSDLAICFSPERYNPGGDLRLSDIPKIIAARSDVCLEKIKFLYSCVFKELVVANSIKEAETAKVFENSYRAVNISLVNELRDNIRGHGMSAEHVISLAATKGFGFEPFSPSIGIGGHCIPVDPFLLGYVYKDGMNSLVVKALAVNEEVVKRGVGYIRDVLSKRVVDCYKKKIVILGLSYKENVADHRNSAAKKIAQSLKEEGFNILVYDPLFECEGECSGLLTESPDQAAVLVFLVPHGIFSEFDFASDCLELVIDGCGAVESGRFSADVVKM